MQIQKCLAFAGLFLLPLASADPLAFRSNDGQTIVTYRGIQWVQINPKNSRYLFTGGIEAKFLKPGVTISADHATAAAETIGGKTRIATITAINQVHFVQVGKKSGATQTSALSCDRLVYSNGTVTSSAVCTGSVVLTQTDGQKRQTIRATGGVGKAVFAGGIDVKNSHLTSATLERPVDVQIVQAPADGGKPDHIHITCSQLVYKPGPTSGTLELTGNIRVTSSQGSLGNFKRAIVRLSAKGEAQGFDGSGGQ